MAIEPIALDHLDAAPPLPSLGLPLCDATTSNVALVHDYLTQRGGAERVVLEFVDAFPTAPLYTSLYDPDRTFHGFKGADIRPAWWSHLSPLRQNHRIGLPLFAPYFSRMVIDAPVTICSSSGWSHGVRTTGRKVVYCHTPARWLYQEAAYLSDRPHRGAKLAIKTLAPWLRRWDTTSATTADRYLVNSSVVRRRVQDLYRHEAEVLIPPARLSPSHPQEPVEGAEDGFFLCVARAMPYKRIDAVVEAFQDLPDERLIVVGSGPQLRHLRRIAPRNVSFASGVSDAKLCWLYSHCQALVTASFEDLGLTPLEAANFGKPVAALRWGGHLDTIVEGQTGVFFDAPEAKEIRRALEELQATGWSCEGIQGHGAGFSSERFRLRLQEVAEEEVARL